MFQRRNYAVEIRREFTETSFFLTNSISCGKKARIQLNDASKKLAGFVRFCENQTAYTKSKFLLLLYQQFDGVS